MADDELLTLIQQAKDEVATELGDYRALIHQLETLEDAARNDRLTPELAEETEETIMQFPGLLGPRTKAVRRPGEPTTASSALNQLANKLVPLAGERR